MSAHDHDTISFYSDEADAYTSQNRQADYDRLETFMRTLPVGGKILELGCGAGDDSAIFLGRGFNVTPTDGTPEIAHAASQRLKRPVPVLLFENLDEKDAYDGVWANACLLHVPRKELFPIINRIYTALKQKGVFYASFKAGTQEGRDSFGRYFNYPTTEWLYQTYHSLPWDKVDIVEDIGSGYDKKTTRWLYVTASKKR